MSLSSLEYSNHLIRENRRRIDRIRAELAAIRAPGGYDTHDDQIGIQRTILWLELAVVWAVGIWLLVDAWRITRPMAQAVVFAEGDTLEERLALMSEPARAAVDLQNKAALIRQYESLNRITADDLFDHLVQAGFEILRKTATRCDQVPPDLLRRIYTEDALRTNSVHVLAAKGG